MKIMEKQRDSCVLPNETGAEAARMQEEMCNVANSCRQQLEDLTRLRIERNKVARHARCAVMRLE